MKKLISISFLMCSVLIFYTTNSYAIAFHVDQTITSASGCCSVRVVGDGTYNFFTGTSTFHGYATFSGSCCSGTQQVDMGIIATVSTNAKFNNEYDVTEL